MKVVRRFLGVNKSPVPLIIINSTKQMLKGWHTIMNTPMQTVCFIAFSCLIVELGNITHQSGDNAIWPISKMTFINFVVLI